MDRSLNPFHPTRQYTGGEVPADTNRLDRKVQLINASQNADNDTTALERQHSAPHSTTVSNQANDTQSTSLTSNNAQNAQSRVANNQPIAATQSGMHPKGQYYGSMDGSDCGQLDQYCQQHRIEFPQMIRENVNELKGQSGRQDQPNQQQQQSVVAATNSQQLQNDPFAGRQKEWM